MPADLTHASVHLAIVAASLTLFVVSGRAPAIARLLLSALLAIAAGVALAAALVAPGALAAVTAYAPLALYRQLVDHVLGPHPSLTFAAVGLVAGLSAIGLLEAGRPARAATATAIAALIAIVPFGAGTAFPAPLFAAASLWLVSREPGLLDDAALRWRGPTRRPHAMR